MIKLLLDQGLPRSAVELLRSLDVDAVHVGDIGAATATDAEILELARRQQRIVVTLDADFHALIALTGEMTPSVIRLRLQGLRGASLVVIIQNVITRCLDDLLHGALVTVTETKIRIRKLPQIREP